jgi:hypothetical protein
MANFFHYDDIEIDKGLTSEIRNAIRDRFPDFPIKLVCGWRKQSGTKSIPVFRYKGGMDFLDKNKLFNFISQGYQPELVCCARL